VTLTRASAALALLLLVACGRESSDPRTFDLALETAPNRLDPAFAIDVGEGEICSLLFEGLVGFDPAGLLVPALARSWDVDASATRYVFHLDTRSRFSTGRAVRAQDVIASFTRVLSPATASPRAWVLERVRGARDVIDGKTAEVAGLSAPDDSTVVVNLDEPFAPFLSLLALPAARVVDLSAGSPAEGTVPAGSGTWTLSEWLRGDRLTLVPNPHHARRARNIDRLRLRIIPEPFTRLAEFESGTLDVLEIPDAEVPRFRSDAGLAPRLLERPELRVMYVGLNNERFADPRVRRALNHAVNVEQIIRVMLGGAAVPAHGSVPPGLAGYRERPGFGYDPARARALLAEAGYPEGLDIEIWQRESAEGNRVVEAVQGYLQESGVRATLVRREWSAVKQAVSAGKVDAFLLDWFADYPDAENFLYPLFHSENFGGGGNRARFHDAAVDALLDAASRTADASARDSLYARTDSLVYAAAPWIYLYFPTSYHIVSERVTGYRLPAIYLGNDFSGVTKTP